MARFTTFLDELSRDPRNRQLPAYDALCRMLTYSDRLSLKTAVESLGFLEREIFRRTEIDSTLRLQDQAQEGVDSVPFTVGYGELGKLYITQQSSTADATPSIAFLAGALHVPLAAYEAAQVAAKAQWDVETRLRREMSRVLVEADARGALGALLDDVADSVRHVEAVYLYIDDAIWGVAERCSTLLGGKGEEGVMPRLRRTPLAAWTSAEKFGIVALRALFVSGRSVRFEEYNGKHLTAIGLCQRFSELEDMYVGQGAGVPHPQPSDIVERAARIRELSLQSVRQGWVRYRAINGLTYVKNEAVTAAPSRAMVNALVPRSIVDLYESWLRRRHHRDLDYEDLFSDLARFALRPSSSGSSERGPAKSRVEVLMQEIVTSATLQVNADYGMSSSIRSIEPLLEGDHERFVDRLLALTPKEFFTCIVSRPGLTAINGDHVQKHIYTAVQQRMQFNRWHFIAGNFGDERIRANRHFYYPPVIPDIAEWADQRHAGHVNGDVRFSIRCPGPDMAEPPFMINDREYRGFYDIRVVRMIGPPFTTADMLKVRAHRQWLGIVWRELVARSETAAGVWTITGFETGCGYEPQMETLPPTALTNWQPGDESSMRHEAAT